MEAYSRWVLRKARRKLTTTSWGVCFGLTIRRWTMRLGLIVPIVAMLLVWGVADARAQQWVTNAACDSVLIQGALYPRVAFEIQHCGTRGSVEMVYAKRPSSTGPEDACGVVSAVGPEKWYVQVDTMATGEVVVLWARSADDDAPTLLPGESLGGFQLVLTAGHSCCFEFSFIPPTSEPLAYENDCFECARVVPIIGRTWGALKNLYR
jgi:hypothetical protein